MVDQLIAALDPYDPDTRIGWIDPDRTDEIYAVGDEFPAGVDLDGWDLGTYEIVATISDEGEDRDVEWGRGKQIMRDRLGFGTTLRFDESEVSDR